MIAKTLSARGVEAHPSEVEVDLSVGLANFTIVGLPDGTIEPGARSPVRLGQTQQAALVGSHLPVSITPHEVSSPPYFR